ncbi:tRNA (cytidine(56)-2'-O)-methyltransferase [Candidatus Woesearchaeota archaeon]|nr:tRNA (cytidine(56)-2'-O)-methyltransferase [Candidatus Woesearchaeota archaeon]MBT7474720.1 tRNA (cytidine(56)-2'-O)-methyltransferase [Candidatus Woesearchaeota archaeon]
MMIEVLRLGHRISRDKRISTHVALVARSFGASKIYYTGQKDGSYENSVERIVSEFGGNFSIEHVESYKKLFAGKTVVHLTMYGEDFLEVSDLKGDILIVVGGEKVPGEVYELADYNVGVTNQPHSEVAALGVFMDHLVKSSYPTFKDGKVRVKPSTKGKEFY